jgi:hypothetical protein
LSQHSENLSCNLEYREGNHELLKNIGTDFSRIEWVMDAGILIFSIGGLLPSILAIGGGWLAISHHPATEN